MLPATRALLVSLAGFAAGLALLDLAVARYAPAHFIPVTRLRDAVALGDRCVVTIGDSHMAAALDPNVASDAAGTCVAALGIGATGLEGQAITLREYLDRRTPTMVVLGVGLGPLPLDPPDPKELIGNRAIELAWSRPADVTRFYPGWPLRNFDRGLRYSLERTNALTSYESLFWMRVQQLQARITGDEPRGARNEFGLVDDMAILGEKFARNDLAAVATMDGNFRNSAWFEDVRALARSRGARLVVVKMPMRSSYRARMAAAPEVADYERWLAADTAEHGEALIDLRALLPDDQFSDGLHADKDGELVFSAALGRALRPLILPAPSPR